MRLALGLELVLASRSVPPVIRLNATKANIASSVVCFTFSSASQKKSPLHGPILVLASSESVTEPGLELVPSPLR